MATQRALATAVLCWITPTPAHSEAEWIRLPRPQTTEDEVLPRKMLDMQPKRILCHEAELPSSGVDVITESQWTVVARIVVDPTGRVERFKLIYGPRLNLELAAPLEAALREWRFERPTRNGVPRATELTVAFPKLPGAWSTKACRGPDLGGAREVPSASRQPR